MVRLTNRTAVSVWAILITVAVAAVLGSGCAKTDYSDTNDGSSPAPVAQQSGKQHPGKGPKLSGGQLTKPPIARPQ